MTFCNSLKEYKEYSDEELFEPFVDFLTRHKNISINVSKKGHFRELDLWASLLLFIQEIIELETIDIPVFKNSIRSKAHDEQFAISKKLLEVCSSSILPNYSTFLAIICGGSCCQKCSFCNAAIRVKAIAWLDKGFKLGSCPVVHREPDYPQLFCCRRRDCVEQLNNAFVERISVDQAFNKTLDKMGASRCDYCFSLAKEVHRRVVYLCFIKYMFRCNTCFSKVWCSSECFLKNKEFHKTVCHKDVPKRKKMGGKEERQQSRVRKQEIWRAEFETHIMRQEESYGRFPNADLRDIDLVRQQIALSYLPTSSSEVD